jgi:hypothetical protein
MRTGESVRQSGVYISDCCDDEMIFQVNDCFSDCSKCARVCWWDLEKPLISWEELEFEQQAA